MLDPMKDKGLLVAYHAFCGADRGDEHIVPLKKIEYGFGYILIRSPYTP